MALVPMLRAVLPLLLAAWLTAAGASTSISTSTTRARDTPVGVALVGADGPTLTQVEEAQQLGLSGQGITICVVDTGVDITSANFGPGCPEDPHGDKCRVAFSYDAESDTDDPSPTGLLGRGGHGTHVAGIALGSFPDKLLNSAGRPLPNQRGVAFRASLGAIRASSTSVGDFPFNLTDRALKKTVRKRCDINNLSFGSFVVAPNPAYESGMQLTAEAGILTTAAAGNDEGAAFLGPRVWNVASPGAFASAFAVAHINSEASAGGTVQVSAPIRTSSGRKSLLAATQRADTQSSLCFPTCEEQLKLPLGLYLIRMFGQPPPPPGQPRGAMPACGWEVVTRGVNATNATAADSDGWRGARSLLGQSAGRTSSSRRQAGGRRGAGGARAAAADEPSPAIPPGQVVVLQMDEPCRWLQASQELVWDRLQKLKPALVLLVPPTDLDSDSGALYYRNGQVPVLWMRADDGAALADALAAQMEAGAAAATAAPPLLLVDLPGARMVDLPPDFAGQPAVMSSLGPGFDLSLKPDVAAPGTLRSSLPNNTYQTWSGTSQAAPYLAGVLALWKEAVLARDGGAEPPGGWIAAAFTAIKNTAAPVRYKGTRLAWPPAKVGAGVVQAAAAVTNRVSVAPPELLMRTDVASQRITLNLTNSGAADVTYIVGHKPAVAVSLTRAWYGRAIEPRAPVAAVIGTGQEVTVPARASRQVEITITLPAELRQLDVVVGGYVTFYPVSTPQGASATAAPAKRQQQPKRSGGREAGGGLAGNSTGTAAGNGTGAGNSTGAGAAGNGTGASVAPRRFDLAAAAAAPPVPLSVPYQTTSKDFSTIGTNSSLALFIPAVPDLSPKAAALISGSPPIFVCDFELDDSGCGHNPEGVGLDLAASFVPGFVLGSALLRPVGDVKLQVWSADGAEHLGTSPSLGPAPGSGPLRRTYLFEGSWNGSYHPVAGAKAAAQSGGSGGNATAAAAAAAPAAGGSSKESAEPHQRVSAGAQAQQQPKELQRILVPMQPGVKHLLKVELWPVLAAGDKAAGRRQAPPMLYDVAAPVWIVSSPSASPGPRRAAAASAGGAGRGSAARPA